MPNAMPWNRDASRRVVMRQVQKTERNFMRNILVIVGLIVVVIAVINLI